MPTLSPASDPNNVANWDTVSFGDGSSFSLGGVSAGQLNPLPSLPAIGGAQTVNSSGGAPASGGNVLGSIAAPIAPSNPASGGASLFTVNPASGPATGSISDYFLRAIIVILGFIFVAVGLNMFRPGIVPDPRNIRHPGAVA